MLLGSEAFVDKMRPRRQARKNPRKYAPASDGRIGPD
jgi:hypothetical protein